MTFGFIGSIVNVVMMVIVFLAIVTAWGRLARTREIVEETWREVRTIREALDRFSSIELLDVQRVFGMLENTAGRAVQVEYCVTRIEKIAAETLSEMRRQRASQSAPQ